MATCIKCDCGVPKKLVVGNFRYRIVLILCGESEWEKNDLYCGWYDSQLTPQGTYEALYAAKTLKEARYKFDFAFTSVLSRAQSTLRIILEETKQINTSIIPTWYLNDRHYGALTGMNKYEAVSNYGLESICVWNETYQGLPPFMEEDHPCYHQLVHDPRYENGPTEEEFLMSESIEHVVKRTMVFWNKEILPKMKAGKRIIVVGHWASLIGIIKFFDNIYETNIFCVDLPRGVPVVYFLNRKLQPVKNGSRIFLRKTEPKKKPNPCLQFE